jgi:hypothetical protein
LPDLKILGGIISLFWQKKGEPNTKFEQKPNFNQNPNHPPLLKLGTNRPMVETPPPLTQHQQRNAPVNALTMMIITSFLPATYFARDRLYGRCSHCPYP